MTQTPRELFISAYSNWVETKWRDNVTNAEIDLAWDVYVRARDTYMGVSRAFESLTLAEIVSQLN